MKQTKTFLLIAAILTTLVGCSKQPETIEPPKLTANAKAIELKKIYYNNEWFTQGFEMDPINHEYFITSGLYGKSKIIKANPTLEQIQKETKLPDEIFIEGLTIKNNEIYTISWKEKKGFVFDKETLELIQTFDFNQEGWGLAYDKKNDLFWVSDGSNILKAFKDLSKNPVKIIRVKQNDQPIHYINELEYVDGYLYANVWQTNNIIRIDLEKETLDKVYNLNFEYNAIKQQYENADVLNGLAHIDNHIFIISGKNFPYALEMQLQ